MIRNEEKCINRIKDTGERKDTKEREETKGRMRGPSYTNWTKEKTPNNRTLKTKRNPNILQTYFFFISKHNSLKRLKTPTYTERIPGNKGQNKQKKNQKTNHPSIGGNPLQEI